jgi:hypothetical protein
MDRTPTQTTPRSTRRRLSITVAALVVSALALAACGGGSTNAGVASLGTTTTAPNAAAPASNSSPGGELALYATCMRANGISNFPNAATFEGPNGMKALKGQMAQIAVKEASSPAFQAAQRACAKYYGTSRSTPHVSPERMTKLLAVSRCMRAHGVPSFPDPNPVTGELTTPANIDRHSPHVIAALAACSALARAAGLGPPSTAP